MILTDPGVVVGPHALVADTMIVAWLATIVAGTLIPALVDLITAASAPPWVKVAVASGLSALAAVIPTVTFSHGERWTDYLFQVFLAFVASQVAHRTGYSNVVQRLVPGGVGATTPTEVKREQ